MLSNLQTLADFCLIPMGVSSSVTPYIAECQRILESSGLEFKMHSYGTSLSGNWYQVNEVIGLCHEKVHSMGCPRISTSIRIGTRKDKVSSMKAKVESVERYLAGDSEGDPPDNDSKPNDPGANAKSNEDSKFSKPRSSTSSTSKQSQVESTSRDYGHENRNWEKSTAPVSAWGVDESSFEAETNPLKSPPLPAPVSPVPVPSMIESPKSKLEVKSSTGKAQSEAPVKRPLPASNVKRHEISSVQPISPPPKPASAWNKSLQSNHVNANNFPPPVPTQVRNYSVNGYAQTAPSGLKPDAPAFSPGLGLNVSSSKESMPSNSFFNHGSAETVYPKSYKDIPDPEDEFQVLTNQIEFARHNDEPSSLVTRKILPAHSNDVFSASTPRGIDEERTPAGANGSPQPANVQRKVLSTLDPHVQRKPLADRGKGKGKATAEDEDIMQEEENLYDDDVADKIR